MFLRYKTRHNLPNCIWHFVVNDFFVGSTIHPNEWIHLHQMENYFFPVVLLLLVSSRSMVLFSFLFRSRVLFSFLPVGFFSFQCLLFVWPECGMPRRTFINVNYITVFASFL